MGISAARNKWYSVLLIQEADFHTYMRWKLVRSHGNQISVEECSILVTLGQNYRFGKGKLFSVFLFPGIRENFFAKPEHFSKCFVTVALICANMARSVRCQSGTALKCVGKVAKNRQECCPKTLERSAARACSSFQPFPTVTGNRVSLLWHAFPFFFWLIQQFSIWRIFFDMQRKEVEQHAKYAVHLGIEGCASNSGNAAGY